MSAKRRVVITGMGILSPVGNNLDDAWTNLLDGKSGIKNIEHFDATNFGTKFAGLVDNFDPNSVVDVKEQRKMDLFIQYGLYAGQEALKDAGLEDLSKVDLDRFGVAAGSGIGGLLVIENNANAFSTRGPRRLSPFFIPAAIVNMLAGHLSIRYGLRGPNVAISTACTTGTHNIGLAARMIAYGDADLMLAGGAEKASTNLGIGGFGALHALSTRNDDPQTASRPWDKERDGFVLGDGAGILVLESLESAQKRGAKIYAEIKGFGMSADGFHMTSPPPNGEGAALAMFNALKDAGLTAKDIDYVNAHGTSTPVGDLAEAKAIESVFTDKPEILVSSTKSMTGHLLGAAGAIETIFTTLSVCNDIIPPTINVFNQDPEVKLDICANKKREITINHALCNNFGFGGTNGSLLISKFKE